LRAEGFFYNLDVLYGGLGIDRSIVVFDHKKIIFFQLKFFQLFVIRALEPDWIRIRIGIQPKMLDPEPFM
jgi:hypothetical protein